MLYLHNSPLGSHGSLKSSNCLVDNRWVLKINSYANYIFTQNENRDLAEYQKYKKLLWTAPELLRMEINRPPKGTPKGDIYSFGIIVNEILYRAFPFSNSLLGPKGLYFLTFVQEFI